MVLSSTRSKEVSFYLSAFYAVKRLFKLKQPLVYPNIFDKAK